MSTKKLLVATTTAALCGAFAVSSLAASSKTVNVNDDFFSPKTISVKKGTTIKFKFNGFHNVEANGKKAFANIPNRGSGTVSRKANKKGSFNLVCTLHDGMTAKLRVK
jgi:plastocyanin